MSIDGTNYEHLGAIFEEWELGTPIDVSAFMERINVPVGIKRRVKSAGEIRKPRPSQQEEAEAYRFMQAQILIEAFNLHLERSAR